VLEAEGFSVGFRVVDEVERQHAEGDEVLPVDASEAVHDDDRQAEEPRCEGDALAARALPVVGTAHHGVMPLSFLKTSFVAMIAKATKRTELGSLCALPTARNARVALRHPPWPRPVRAAAHGLPSSKLIMLQSEARPTLQ